MLNATKSEKCDRFRDDKTGKFLSGADANLDMFQHIWNLWLTRQWIPARSVAPMQFRGHKFKSRTNKSRQRAQQQAAMFGFTKGK